MPGPAVYVLAVIGTIGAVIAFKEFVYEPHIAPRIEQWAAEFVEQRRARRRQQHPIPVVSIPVRLHRRGSKGSDATNSDNDDDSAPSGQRRGVPRRSLRRSGVDSLELEKIVASEVIERRNNGAASNQPGIRDSQNLRHRKNTSAHITDEPINSIAYLPMSPTHVIYDSSPSSTAPSAVPSPPQQSSPLPNIPPPTPPKSPTQIQQPTPTPSIPPSLPQVEAPSPIQSHNYPLLSLSRNNDTSSSPTPLAFGHNSVPSLSQSYPQNIDQESGVELVSPPSSRPETPFSVLSPFSVNSNLGSPSPQIVPHPLSPRAVVRLPQPRNEAYTALLRESPVPRAPSTASEVFHSFSSSSSSPSSSLSDLPTGTQNRLPAVPTNAPANESRLSSSSSTLQVPPANTHSPVSPVSPTSPRSPFSQHAELSDLDFMSDFDDARSDSSWSSAAGHVIR